MSELARRVRQRRAELGMSQEELAAQKAAAETAEGSVK